MIHPDMVLGTPSTHPGSQCRSSRYRYWRRECNQNTLCRRDTLHQYLMDRDPSNRWKHRTKSPHSKRCPLHYTMCSHSKLRLLDTQLHYQRDMEGGISRLRPRNPIRNNRNPPDKATAQAASHLAEQYHRMVCTCDSSLQWDKHHVRRSDMDQYMSNLLPQTWFHSRTILSSNTVCNQSTVHHLDTTCLVHQDRAMYRKPRPPPMYLRRRKRRGHCMVWQQSRASHLDNQWINQLDMRRYIGWRHHHSSCHRKSSQLAPVELVPVLVLAQHCRHFRYRECRQSIPGHRGILRSDLQDKGGYMWMWHPQSLIHRRMIQSRRRGSMGSKTRLGGIRLMIRLDRECYNWWLRLSN